MGVSPRPGSQPKEPVDGHGAVHLSPFLGGCWWGAAGRRLKGSRLVVPLAPAGAAVGRGFGVLRLLRVPVASDGRHLPLGFVLKDE